MKKQLLFLIMIVCIGPAMAQGSYFGVKGGLTVGLQSWEGLERDPLLAFHGIAFIESAEETESFGLFAQVGYHVKGSAIRNRNFFNPLTNNFFRPPAREFKFNNLSLTVGGKQKFPFIGNSKAYYLIGIRGDYTLSTNLGEYNKFLEANPTIIAVYLIDSDEFIRKINYGVTAGGGIETAFNEFVGMLFEFTINPDFSVQYQQPPINNVLDPYTGNTRTISEKKVRNLTFELTVGFRFLRKVEYID